MPVYSADNSFESDFSEIGRPVESGNYQEKGQFKNIFDSVSLDYEEKMNMEKSIDKQVHEKALESTTSNLESINGKKVLKNTSKKLFHKNNKLMSLKKGKVVKSDGGRKKNGKKISSLNTDDSPFIIVTGKHNDSLKMKNEGIKDILLDSGHENQNVNEQTSHELNLVRKNKIIVDTNTVEGKSPFPPIADSSMKKISLKKDIIDRKSAKVKKSGRGDTSKSKLSVLDLRDKDINSKKLLKKLPSTELSSQKTQSDSADLLDLENHNSAKPIVIELTHVKDNFSGESRTLTTFSGSALMKQLEESINSKIVKQSSVILKDSGAGEIKLILKPEQLGKVRIKLNMQDNRISGNIIVDNASVKEIFESNLQNLERAFRENGFDTAALNVSVGGDSSGSGSREKSNDITKQIKLIDKSIPMVYAESENLIDLVV